MSKKQRESASQDRARRIREILYQMIEADNALCNLFPEFYPESRNRLTGLIITLVQESRQADKTVD